MIFFLWEKKLYRWNISISNIDFLLIEISNCRWECAVKKRCALGL
jgi:hypothetical protein